MGTELIIFVSGLASLFHHQTTQQTAHKGVGQTSVYIFLIPVLYSTENHAAFNPYSFVNMCDGKSKEAFRDHSHT